MEADQFVAFCRAVQSSCEHRLSHHVWVHEVGRELVGRHMESWDRFGRCTVIPFQGAWPLGRLVITQNNRAVAEC